MGIFVDPGVWAAAFLALTYCLITVVRYFINRERRVNGCRPITRNEMDQEVHSIRMILRDHDDRISRIGATVSAIGRSEGEWR